MSGERENPEPSGAWPGSSSDGDRQPGAEPATAPIATYTILPEGASAPAPRRGMAAGPWAVVGVLALVLVLIVGGVVVALRFLSGGGTQPEQMLPSTAFAYAKLDLDPSAGQKLDAVRFLRKFPQTKDKVSESSDLRKVFFDLASSSGGFSGTDYARDVEPWLGQRIGIAALAPSAGAKTPDFAIALQVTDEGKAREGLRRLAASVNGGTTGFVVQDGWAVVSSDDAKARAIVAAAARANLASAPTFVKDMARLGDGGLVTFWADVAQAQKAAGDLTGSLGVAGLGAGGLASGGRLAYALRFAGPDVLELSGSVTGAQALNAAREPTAGITALPDSTVAAVGVSGLDGMVDGLWQQVRTAATSAGATAGFDASVKQAQQEYGIALPADLEVLLGKDLLAALDGHALSDGDAEVGLRVVTDPVKGKALADRLAVAAHKTGAPLHVVARQTADGYVLASSTGQADRMTGRGALGEKADFRKALPDVATAQFALWVDVDAISALFSDGDTSDATKALAAIDGIGVTAVIDGDNATFRLRLVAH